MTNEEFRRTSHAQLCGGAMVYRLAERWKNLTKVLVEINSEMMSFQLGSYSNGRTAVVALGEDGAPYAKLTVNLDDRELVAMVLTVLRLTHQPFADALKKENKS